MSCNVKQSNLRRLGLLNKTNDLRQRGVLSDVCCLNN